MAIFDIVVCVLKENAFKTADAYYSDFCDASANKGLNFEQAVTQKKISMLYFSESYAVGESYAEGRILVLFCEKRVKVEQELGTKPKT